MKTCHNTKHSIPANRSTGATHRFQPSSELVEKVDEPNKPRTGFLNHHHHDSALSVRMLWTILFHTYRSDVAFARCSLSIPESIEITPGKEIFPWMKVARPSIFVDTPSIFESLLLEQVDLYWKNIITHVLYMDLTLLWYYFCAIRINITWQSNHNSFSPKSNFCH